MDYSAELRYYEIRFIKLLNHYQELYPVSKLKEYLEMQAFIVDADTSKIIEAMQTFLTDMPQARIAREEYIVCLSLFTGLSKSQIRKIVRCSPNLVVKAVNDYHSEDIFVTHKLSLAHANEIRKVMKPLIESANIY